MNDSSIVPVMPVGGNGDFGGNGFLWLILIFFLFSMGGGAFGGWNGNGGVATSQELQNGFDNQNNMANQREILGAINAGTTQTTNAVNGVYHDLASTFTDKYSELQRDIAGIAVTQAQALANQNECCANTRLQIAEQTANLGSQIAQNKYDTSLQMSQMEARIMSKMDANEIQNLRDQVQQLQLQNATNGMLKFPSAWTYTGGYFPPINGCPCGGNI